MDAALFLEIVIAQVAVLVLLYRTDLIMDALDIPRWTLDKRWRPRLMSKTDRDRADRAEGDWWPK